MVLPVIEHEVHFERKMDFVGKFRLSNWGNDSASRNCDAGGLRCGGLSGLGKVLFLVGSNTRFYGCKFYGFEPLL